MLNQHRWLVHQESLLHATCQLLTHAKKVVKVEGGLFAW
jgi:hypothetical protein